MKTTSAIRSWTLLPSSYVHPVAVLKKWWDIEIFGRAKESWFCKYLELPHGIPSHDNLARVLSLLNLGQFNRCFLSWVKAINPRHEQEIINIDWKTLRRSHGKGKSAIHIVSVWANKAGLTLGQAKVDNKSNEIMAILSYSNCWKYRAALLRLMRWVPRKPLPGGYVKEGPIICLPPRAIKAP